MSLAPIPQSQQDRLRHIELRLRFLGEVRRPDVMLRFGIQSAAASRDLAVYRDLAPQNIEFDSRSKGYLLGSAFSPLFPTSADQALAWLAEEHHHLLGVTDPDYPALLTQIEEPPVALFVDGDPARLWHPASRCITAMNLTVSSANCAK